MAAAAWDTRSTVSARLVAALVFALCLHAPLALAPLPRGGTHEYQRPPTPLTIQFAPSAIDESKPADEALADAQPLASLQPPPAPAAFPEPQLVPPAKPVTQRQPEPASRPEPTPKAEPKRQEAAPPPKLPALESFSKPTVGFDESIETKEKPPEGLLSDRTSTAADRGPKDLPRGDPYNDKGESDLIRALQRRGENNLPPLKLNADAGSVKRSGSPDAGRKTETPQRRPEPDKLEETPAKTLPAKPIETPPALRPQPLAVPHAQKPVQSDTAVADLGEEVVTKRSTLPLLPPQPLDTQARSAPHAAVAETTPTDKPRKPTHLRTPERTPQDELAEFTRELDEIEPRAGNEQGPTPGGRNRLGQKGHEGDGTLRPGHSEAVSDVNTFNISSSAAEFDEARFAKIKDPVVAYFKPLLRRVDGKWKAEIAARARFRPLRGAVRIKIVVRKDGTLLEASEVSRLPSDLPDEFASIAKLAVERAAEGGSEPFPSELVEHETLQFTVGFLY